MRKILPVVLLLAAACAKQPSTHVAEDDVARGAAGQAASTAAAASVPGAADAVLGRFLAERGEDVEACFQDLPQLERDPANASFAGREGVAQASGANRLMLAIDASGSMAGKAGRATKMQAAKQAAAEFLGDVPQHVAVGMIAFGHRGSNREADKAASCAAVETVYPLGKADRTQIRAALASFDATGWTPLARAIEQAGQALGPISAGNGQAIYVVSDGEDTCGGDPVRAARTLHEGGAKAIVNIIGFDLAAKDREQLKAVAEAGGGTFVEVSAARAASLGDELRRSNHNFFEQMRSSNQTFGRKLRNSNRTFQANLDLSNCVFTRSLSESNAAHDWARKSGVDSGHESPLMTALGSRHDGFDARVKAYENTTESQQESVNAELQSAQDRIDREAENTR